MELVERLAALVPPPRKNQVLYHGVLAPRAAWRQLRRHTFDVDGSACPRCGQSLRLRAIVMPPATLRVLRGLQGRAPPRRQDLAS